MSLPLVLAAVQAAGHVVFTSGDWNMNCVVQRDPSNIAGEMDDTIGLYWRVDGHWQARETACTADPGRKTLLDLPNPLGAPWIELGQYRRAYELGLHKGRKALREVEDITIRRDRDRNGNFDRNGPIYTGNFGMHVHDGKTPDWSEGCIVVPLTPMIEMYDIVQVASTKLSANGKAYGPRVTLTVIGRVS